MIEDAVLATSGDNQKGDPLYITDLGINPNTLQAEPINTRPILPQREDSHQVRENMKNLLDHILGYFELEEQKVENGQLSELNALLETYVQENDPGTQHTPRSLPKGFNHR